MCHSSVAIDGSGLLLTIELTFYAALPAYAWLVARLTRAMRLRTWMAAELALLAALSAISVLAEFSQSQPAPAWVSGSVLGFVFWFALGMGMAVASVGLAGARPGPRMQMVLRTAPALLWALAGALYRPPSVGQTATSAHGPMLRS